MWRWGWWRSECRSQLAGREDDFVWCDGGGGKVSDLGDRVGSLHGESAGARAGAGQCDVALGAGVKGGAAVGRDEKLTEAS